jgi:hypothetical protein
VLGDDPDALANHERPRSRRRRGITNAQQLGAPHFSLVVCEPDHGGGAFDERFQTAIVSGGEILRECQQRRDGESLKHLGERSDDRSERRWCRNEWRDGVDDDSRRPIRRDGSLQIGADLFRRYGMSSATREIRSIAKEKESTVA